jgi:flagellar M-ring protein FliF
MADNSSRNALALPGKLAGAGGLMRTPGVRQGLLLVGIAAAVALGVAMVLWLRAPSYALLYGGLSAQDASAVTQALANMSEPYQLSPDGSSIMVPQGDLASVRLKLAAQGLPRGTATLQGGDSGSGSPFGLSDYAEKIHYQDRLERDLASTISSLQPVQSARVHLALPKPSAFISDRRPASASVLLTLYPGRTLDAGQVAAIVHLVSSSVPDLEPGNVAVVDQKGDLLTASTPGSASAIADGRFRTTQMIENAYAARIEQMLAPLVGANHVRAQVVANLDFTQTEQTSETYNGAKPALRSEQTSMTQRTEGGGAQGIPGALSNQPPVQTPQATAANPGAAAPGAAPAAAASAGKGTPMDVSKNATRNFELDRTIAHTKEAVGGVRRISVAVLVDDKRVVGKDGKAKEVPYGAKELAEMTELVKTAVGYDAKRGDTVSLVNVAFRAAADAAAAPPSTPFWQRPGIENLIKLGIGALLLLSLIFGVLRPLLRALLAPSAAPGAAAAQAQIGADEPAPDRVTLGHNAALPMPSPAVVEYEQKLAEVKRLADKEPRQVAQIVQGWVGADG